MKRIALVLALIAFSSSAYAGTMLPQGCYVSYSNPNYCFVIPSGDTLVWTISTDMDMLNTQYGNTMALILARYAEDDISLNQCKTERDNCGNNYNTLLQSYNAAGADRDTCISDYNGLVTQYNGRGTQISTLNASLTAQKKLVKKLKKACGTKCKKIK